MNTSCQTILLHVLVLNLMWRALGAWQELSGVELDIKDALSILLYGAWKGPWNTWLIDCLLGDKGHKTICYPNDNYHSPPRHSAPNTPLVPLGRAHAPRVLLNPWCATHLSHTTSKHKASYSVTFVVSAWEISFHLIKLRFSKMHMSSCLLGMRIERKTTKSTNLYVSSRKGLTVKVGTHEGTNPCN